MNPELIIRAWKDPEFRARLTSEQLQALPENPSGKPMTELGEEDLTDVVGGVIIQPTTTVLRTRDYDVCGTGPLTLTKGSAYDNCPSALGCTTSILRQTTSEIG